MNIPMGVGAMLQVIAALLIFAASYLALVVCTIACVAVAELFSKRADVIQQYGAKSMPVGTTLSPMDDLSHTSRLAFRRQISKKIGQNWQHSDVPRLQDGTANHRAFQV